jgi:nicotinate-nucleotide adenylyltransferase
LKLYETIYFEEIGLYFGTFNPIHVGHLIIANHMANSDLDQIWMVVTPHNPQKKKKSTLLDDYHRLHGSSCH